MFSAEIDELLNTSKVFKKKEEMSSNEYFTFLLIKYNIEFQNECSLL